MSGDKEPIVEDSYSLGIESAKKITTTTKTHPILESTTPRWFLKFLPWVDVEAGSFRINKVKNDFTNPSLEKYKLFITDEVKIDDLYSTDLLSNLDRQDAQYLLSQMQPREFSTGEIVDKENTDAFFFILKGKVEISYKNEYGNDVRLALLGQGDYFGELGLQDDHLKESIPTKETRALCRTKTIGISKSHFSKFLSKNSNIKSKIKHVIEKRKKTLQAINPQGERIPSFMSFHGGHPEIPAGYFEFESNPRELEMDLIQTILRIHTRISDIYNIPHQQLHEQFRLTVSAMRERQEWNMINDPKTGLISNTDPSMRLYTRKGRPTPDDMDDLIASMWKKPAIFLAHPLAIAAFGRECTRRGVPPPTVNIFGSPFMTWRGIPLVPTDKLEITKDPHSKYQLGTTKILLLRLGMDQQGVIGLKQSNLPRNPYFNKPGLMIQFNGVDSKGCANYLTTLYYSIASLTRDAVAVLDGVHVGNYYDYD